MIRLQAHRGASRHYPENTMIAYEGAVRENYQLIELDTKFTKDNQCVMLHDFTVNRTARKRDGSLLEKEIRAEELTYAELLELDFGMWFSKEFAGTKIPLFREAVRFACEHQMHIKVDNVLERFSKEKQKQAFQIVKEEIAQAYVGFVAKSSEFAQRAAIYCPDSELHYDGPVNQEILEQLSRIKTKELLTIWLPAQKKSWLTYPPADEKTVALCRTYGSIGLWTATNEENLAYCLSLKPDAMEIEGMVTPEMVNQM